MKKYSEIKELQEKINRWVSERGWEKFQKPKDLAISLSLEAAEVLEHFQWKNDKDVKKHLSENKSVVADELADVAIYLLKLADKTDVNLGEAIVQKLIKQAKKYPIKTVKRKNLAEYYKIKNSSRIK